jgi:hypothetical protein
VLPRWRLGPLGSTAHPFTARRSHPVVTHHTSPRTAIRARWLARVLSLPRASTRPAPGRLRITCHSTGPSAAGQLGPASALGLSCVGRAKLPYRYGPVSSNVRPHEHAPRGPTSPKTVTPEVNLDPFFILRSWKRLGLFVLAAASFACLLLVWDSMASKSHPAALDAIHRNKDVKAQLGTLRFVLPIFFSYRSVTPPYQDCENRGYIAWSDHGLQFLGVSLSRKNMYRDPWSVYAVTIGYFNLPPKVSSNCDAELQRAAQVVSN